MVVSADEYIDYLYDDKEDFFSNVDYSLPASYGYLDASSAQWVESRAKSPKIIFSGKLQKQKKSQCICDVY
jgi:hypothetical protein